jgi:hypothetical protein
MFDDECNMSSALFVFMSLWIVVSTAGDIFFTYLFVEEVVECSFM